MVLAERKCIDCFLMVDSVNVVLTFMIENSLS